MRRANSINGILISSSKVRILVDPLEFAMRQNGPFFVSLGHAVPLMGERWRLRFSPEILLREPLADRSALRFCAGDASRRRLSPRA